MARGSHYAGAMFSTVILPTRWPICRRWKLINISYYRLQSAGMDIVTDTPIRIWGCIGAGHQAVVAGRTDVDNGRDGRQRTELQIANMFGNTFLRQLLIRSAIRPVHRAPR